MASTLLLRVVSVLPFVATPHHHGTWMHTHGSGGIAHEHDHPHVQDTDPTSLDGKVVARGVSRHRHGDGPLHEHVHDDLPQGTHAEHRRGVVRTKAFSMYLLARGPQAVSDQIPPESPTDEHKPPPTSQRDEYFSAAVSVAIPQGMVELPWIMEGTITGRSSHTDPVPGQVVSPRQSRGPPQYPPRQNLHRYFS